jgi:hypothetical protein
MVENFICTQGRLQFPKIIKMTKRKVEIHDDNSEKNNSKNSRDKSVIQPSLTISLSLSHHLT